MPLTDVKIRQAKAADKPLKLADSHGLYLEVKLNGSKFWRYRYKIAGKENLFAIGEYPTVGLSDARKARDDARDLVKDGQHPSHIRQTERARNIVGNANTFKAITQEWVEKQRAKWSPYYLGQVERFMDNDVYPHIGRLPIRSVTAANILTILNRVSDRGAETVALNLRQWCSAVFRYAVVTLRADSDPAAALRGAVIRPPINHSKPMSREEIGEFVLKVRGYGGNRTTAIAVRILLLTFVRTVEMRKAEWTEINLDESEWRIPSEKMKMRRPHIVPLSRQVVALLRELQRITGAGRWLFPNNRRPDDVMSATTVNRALEYMGYASGAVTGHDFRATASTQLHEMGFRPDVIERQLAHAEQNKVKAAYNHAEYLPERRELMQRWADWVGQIEAELVKEAASAE
jgi:integrase